MENVKQALCVKRGEITSFVNEVAKNEGLKLETFFVDREICEKDEEGFSQIVPYIAIYTINDESGEMEILHYRRQTKDAGEERLAGNLSIGFGGHIDNVTDIVCNEIISKEDGSDSFMMTLQELSETCIKTGLREVQEELNVDLNQFGFDQISVLGNSAFYNSDADEVSRCHTAMLLPVKISREAFDALTSAMKANEAEIESIAGLRVNAGGIVESFNVGEILRKISGDLRDKHNMEDWSIAFYNYLVNGECNRLSANVNYADIVMVRSAKAESAVDQMTETTKESTETVVSE